MIIRFSVSNYLSFHELTDFNMVSSDIRSKKDHVKSVNGVELLKFSLIYGANGAGKSNLIQALDIFRDMISKGEVENLSFDTHRFDTDCQDKPVIFEIEFQADSGKVFIYGLSIYDGIIDNEYLYISGLGKSKDKLLFERTYKNEETRFEIENKFLKSKKDRDFLELFAGTILEKNEIALAKFIDFDDRVREFNDFLLDAYYWFSNNLRIIHPDSKPTSLVYNLSFSTKFLEFCNQLLSRVDLGINSLEVREFSFLDFFGEDDKDKKFIKEIEEILKEEDFVPLAFDVIAVKKTDEVTDKIDYSIKKLYLEHKSNSKSVSFSFEEESDGTKRLIEYLSMVYEILAPDINSVFVVDEIERSMHPHLLKEILRKLALSETITGQLIFTTHESNLLDLNMFRQDEIWLTEKDNNGATNFTPLSDFKIRNDLDIRKGYLKGRFGAIPILANFKDLNWHSNAN